jgi:hypothetical protein
VGDDKVPNTPASGELMICLEFGQAKFKVVLAAVFRKVSSYRDLMFPYGALSSLRESASVAGTG